AGLIGRAETFEDARPLAEAARRQFLGDDQLVVGEAGRVVAEHAVLALVAAIGGDDLAAVPGAAEHAGDAPGRVVQPSDDLGLDLTRLAADEPRQRAAARRQLLARAAADQAEQRRVVGAGPADGPRQREAVGIAAGALDRHHLG